ncbi:MAG: competence/damage-inducible protein A [Chloroflexi bacterium RBG_16_64_32]|nr:MAG: competence/damage-inducible protein A [Chloroflexi bacterium RBG_16_64_32]
MKAEIISVGTEILLGEILDTNSRYLAARLPPLGIDLYYISKVGDNLNRLAGTIGRAHERSDLVLITGGLGPTEDDLTREAIALALDEEMFVDADTEQRLRAFFAARGFPFPERNVKQAMLIPSAQAIPNPRGTAPGWWVEKDGRIIVAMPGPPAELERMWEVEVAPRLAGLTTGDVIVSRTLKTVGIGEGQLDEMVSPLLKSENPTVGVYAKQDGVHLRLTAKAATREAAQGVIGPVEEELRRIAGDAVWGADDDTLEGAIGAMLKERNLTLATMESCTGGLLASTITDVPGSSIYFKGGYVAYTAEMKMGLGVSAELIEMHGTVSDEVAADMARAARANAGADLGVAVTGVAGPDELEGKPPGRVHIAVDGGGPAQSVSYTYYQGRAATKRRAVTTALALLRRALLARG